MKHNFMSMRLFAKKAISRESSWQFKSVFLLICFVGMYAITWGVSHAEILLFSNQPNVKASYFSAIGNVSTINIKDKTLSMENAQSSDNTGQTSYTFDLGTANDLELSDYTPILISDIKVGDKIIIQGLAKGSAVEVSRIISFANILPQEPKLVDLVSATSTATSTPSILDNIVDATKSVVGSIVDSVTGLFGGSASTTSTTTDSVATSTDVIATTTPIIYTDVSTSTVTSTQ